MSIIVWRNQDGTLHQGLIIPDGLADIICRDHPAFFPGGRRVAYRIRIKSR